MEILDKYSPCSLNCIVELQGKKQFYGASKSEGMENDRCECKQYWGYVGGERVSSNQEPGAFTPTWAENMKPWPQEVEVNVSPAPHAPASIKPERLCTKHPEKQFGLSG